MEKHRLIILCLTFLVKSFRDKIIINYGYSRGCVWSTQHMEDGCSLELSSHPHPHCYGAAIPGSAVFGFLK